MTGWTAAQILATTVIKTTTNNWAKGYNAMASLKKPKFLQPTIAIVTWPNYYSHTIAKKPCRRIGQIQKCPIILRSGKKKTKWLLFLLERGWNGSREKQAKYRRNTGTVEDMTDSQRKAQKWCVESWADMKCDGDL